MGSIYKDTKEEFRRDILRAINKGLGINYGANFKKKILLHELIDYKIDSDDKRFIHYVQMLDTIKSYLLSRYPFLDLSNLTMN